MDNKTITFIDSSKRFKITVLKAITRHSKDTDRLEFLQSETLYNLNTKWNLGSYLHNEHGPAIIDMENKIYEYYLNGELLKNNDPRIETMKNYFEFGDRFNKFLED